MPAPRKYPDELRARDPFGFGGLGGPGQGLRLFQAHRPGVGHQPR